MKFKKGNRGGVAVELGPEETQLPGAEPQHTFNLKKILVPLDLSDCSRKALQYAVPFARQFEAELILLHVVEPYPQAPELGPVEMDAFQDAKDQMTALEKSLGASVRVKPLVQSGESTNGIIEAAKELDVDLIILSTHGRTGMARVLLGSTTERVVRRAPCPVLVVREREHEFLAGEASEKTECACGTEKP